MFEDLIVHPFGEVESYVVEGVSDAVERQFSMTVRLGERLSAPTRSFSRKRGQYLSTDLLNVLATQELNDARFKLGITNVDLFVPELNFVFGEGSTTLRSAVFSTARLDPRAYGEAENSAILICRATTEAAHELGHVFGLGHCKQSNCVMWFSNTLSETDRKGSKFCRRCAAQLGPLVRTNGP